MLIMFNLITCSYLNRLYVRLMRPIIPFALAIPTDFKDNPFTPCSIKQNTCFPLALVFGFSLLRLFWSSVNGLFCILFREPCWLPRICSLPFLGLGQCKHYRHVSPGSCHLRRASHLMAVNRERGHL